ILCFPFIIQRTKVDLVVSALFFSAGKGGGFLDLRTIHLEEITRWVAEVEQSFDTVSRPRFGSPDTVTAKPIDHREKTRGLDKKSIMRIFGVASRPTARLL